MKLFDDAISFFIKAALFLVEHLLISIVLLFVAALLLVILIYVESIQNKLRSYFEEATKAIKNKKIKKKIKKFTNHLSKEEQIKRDIQTSIHNLNDPIKILPSLQTLCLYPCSEGIKAIIELACKSSNNKYRVALICDLCDAIKNNGWYL
jgi:hypothetical protein